MGVRERRLAIQAVRGQIWSPGRPLIAPREDRVRFWKAIAWGITTEDAAAEAGVSAAVGHAGSGRLVGCRPCRSSRSPLTT